MFLRCSAAITGAIFTTSGRVPRTAKIKRGTPGNRRWFWDPWRVHPGGKGCEVSRIWAPVESQTDPSRRLPATDPITGGPGCGKRWAFNAATREPEPRDQAPRSPGPKSQALRAREDAHLAPGAAGLRADGRASSSITREGSAVTDVDGNTFLDFIGGIGVNALGHSHPTLGRGDAGAGRPRRGRARSPRARASSCSSGFAAHAPAQRRAPAAALLGRRRGGRERAAPRQVATPASTSSSASGAASTARRWARCR